MLKIGLVIIRHASPIHWAGNFSRGIYGQKGRSCVLHSTLLESNPNMGVMHMEIQK